MLRAIVFVSVCLPLLSAADLPEPFNGKVDFDLHVDPIFQRKCYACHGDDAVMNGYSLWRKKDALRGGYSGKPAIIDKDSANSRLIHIVAGLEKDLIMPPVGEKLTNEEIGILRAWIDQGTPFTATRFEDSRLTDATPWLTMDYGPVISASVTVREPEDPRADKGPGDNITYKAHAIALTPEKDATVVFDTELLRYSAGWTGGFLKLTGTVFDWKHGPHPYADGKAVFENPVAPGWARDGVFQDPREDFFGPLPEDWAKYRGRYVHGDRTILAYTVGAAEVLEMPGFTKGGGAEAFSRTFQLGPSGDSRVLQVAWNPGVAGKISPSGGVEFARLGELTVAAAGLPSGSSWDVSQLGHIRLKLPASSSEQRFSVYIAEASNAAKFGKWASGQEVESLEAYTQGGPKRFPEVLVTKGKLGDDSGPWAVDSLTLPFENPWNSWMRPGDIAFFDDDRAVMSTWSGDIWVVKGLDDDLDRLEWRRVATGFYQPQGLEVVDGVIYVLDRNNISRLIDLNGDDEPDFYENFNNDFHATHHFHEFTFDLDRDKQGNFYFAKAARHALPAKVKHHGVILKVDPNGKNLETVCTGFRVPNGVAIGPNGEITTSDQEGHWIPSTRINWCSPGSYHGYVMGGQVNPHRPYDPPIAFLPISVDNSGAGQAWVADDRWGPFKGHLVHSTFGRGKIFLMLMERVNGVIQGGAVELPVDYDAGLMRPDFRAKDGQLYLSGLYGWGTKRKAIGGFYRTRYTGNKAYLPEELHVSKRGVEITFTQPLDKATAEDIANYKASRWNYKWLPRYGSDLFKLNGEQGTESMKVVSAKLSDDNRTVTLEVADLREVMQMQIGIAVKAADGKSVNTEINHTINVLADEPGERVLALP